MPLPWPHHDFLTSIVIPFCVCYIIINMSFYFKIFKKKPHVEDLLRRYLKFHFVNGILIYLIHPNMPFFHGMEKLTSLWQGGWCKVFIGQGVFGITPFLCVFISIAYIYITYTDIIVSNYNKKSLTVILILFLKGFVWYIYTIVAILFFQSLIYDFFLFSCINSELGPLALILSWILILLLDK